MLAEELTRFVAKKASKKARRRRNRCYYNTVYVKVARDGMPITPELMKSIRSPVYKKWITETLFERLVEPEKLQKKVYNTWGLVDCACLKSYNNGFSGYPLICQWDPPTWLLRKYRNRNGVTPSPYTRFQSLGEWMGGIVLEATISLAMIGIVTLALITMFLSIYYLAQSVWRVL